MKLLWLFLVSSQVYAASIYNRIDYTSSNVTTTAWTQIFASTSIISATATIFDSSGQTLEVGVGASGKEAILFLIPPGGGTFPLSLSVGQRLSIRAVSANATSGESDINLFDTK